MKIYYVKCLDRTNLYTVRMFCRHISPCTDTGRSGGRTRHSGCRTCCTRRAAAGWRGNNTWSHTEPPHLAVPVPGVAVISGQTRVAVPAARVTQTRETLARDVVTVARRAQVLIGVAPAGLAVVSDGQRDDEVTVGKTLHHGAGSESIGSMVREIRFADGKEPGERRHEVVVHPQATHGVVAGRVDAHRLLEGRGAGDSLVHLEEVSVEHSFVDSTEQFVY